MIYPRGPPIRFGGPDKIWGTRYQPLYPLENFLSEALCISRFLLVNLNKLGAGMLIKCCILPSRNIKSAKASGALPRTPLGELTVLPQIPYLHLNQFYVQLCFS